MRHPDNKALRVGTGDRWYFWCPGCNTNHMFIPEGAPGKGPRWKVESINPLTVSPSILCTWTHGPDHEQRRCHMFVERQQIRYLKDCTHDLAGQTIPMVDFDEP